MAGCSVPVQMTSMQVRVKEWMRICSISKITKPNSVVKPSTAVTVSHDNFNAGLPLLENTHEAHVVALQLQHAWQLGVPMDLIRHHGAESMMQQAGEH